MLDLYLRIESNNFYLFSNNFFLLFYINMQKSQSTVGNIEKKDSVDNIMHQRHPAPIATLVDALI